MFKYVSFRRRRRFPFLKPANISGPPEISVCPQNRWTHRHYQARKYMARSAGLKNSSTFLRLVESRRLFFPVYQGRPQGDPRRLCPEATGANGSVAQGERCGGKCAGRPHLDDPLSASASTSSSLRNLITRMSVVSWDWATVMVPCRYWSCHIFLTVTSSTT